MQNIGTRRLLEEVVFRGMVDIVSRRRVKHNRYPNVFMRELSGLHGNTTLNDLESNFRKDVADVTDGLLAFINHNGFKLVPKD